MKPTATFETITPDSARIMLESNKKNRSVNRANLNYIISEINRGNFHLTGESIKIAQNGMLLDGQHRLHAVIESKKPTMMLVVRGLSNDAFKYIDTGRKRQASDILAIEGVANSAAISAMAKFIINFKRGNYASVSNSKVDISSNRTPITNADVSNFVSTNKESIEDSYLYGHNKYNKLIKKVTLSGFHFIIKQSNEELADDFCHKVSTGEGIEHSSPIYLLRQKMLQDIRANKKMRSLEKLAILCKAWNLYKTNKTVSILKWDSVKEPFPKPL